MEFLVEYWELVVMVVGALAGLFQTKKWWPYIQAGKELGDVVVKKDLIDKDGIRTDEEILEFGKEVLEFVDALNFKGKQ